ncbi:DUF3810 domain-containing protein [Caproiciproducens sp. LBM24188]
MKERLCRIKFKRFWFLLLAPIALVLNIVAVKQPSFAEWYAAHLYPWISLALNFITSLVPFSIAEVLVFTLPIAALVLLVRFIVRLVRRKGKRGETAVRFAVNLLCIASAVYFAFTLNCGINYSRRTFAQTSGLSVQPSSKEELIALCNSLAEDVNSLRTRVQTDSNSVMKLSQDSIYDTAEEMKAAYDKIHTQYPLLRAGYGRPKPVFASRLMSQTNITGIFFPFTFEANVNTDIPAYSIPVTMGHELSHLRGYMREDEANFIGYLACEQSGNPDFEYSGKMLAFIYASNALYDTDRDVAGQLYATLSEGVQRDLRANSEYWKQFEGPVAQVSTSLNDSYLKANHQESGVKSYGAMVDLLLAEYRIKQGAR